MKVQSTYWMRPDFPGREASLRTTVTEDTYQVHITLPYRTESR